MAIIFGAVKVPVNNPVPWTANNAPGEVVPIPVFPTTKSEFAEIVEEAWRFPATWNGPLIVEDACEINPPDSVERLATSKVEEAFKTPEAWKLPEIVEEAEEINPLDIVI